jgi:hypothetical protein
MMTFIAAIVLNALWQDALLVLCLWLFLRVWPQVNAATRYVVWSSALGGAVLVPVIATYASFVPAHPAASATTPVRERAALQRGASRIAQLFDSPRSLGTMQAPHSAPDDKKIPRLRLTLPVNVARAVVAVWALLTAYALLGLRSTFRSQLGCSIR